MYEFETPAPIAAVLDIPAGRIRLIASERADTAVEVLPADGARDRDVKAAQQTKVDYGDGVLRIEGAAGGRLAGPSGSVEVSVRLPAGSRVEAKAASAELHGAGPLGEVVFEGAQGSVELDDADSARLVLMAGDVKVGRLRGDAAISTQKGAIHVAEAVRGTLVLRTESGDISVGAARGVSASLDAGAAYGRVTNALMNTEGAGAQLTIRATTAHGDITARSL